MKVVVLWLINEKGDVLLSQRTAHIGSDASMWGPSVSGKVDEGETAERALIREVNEELGIDSIEFLPLRYLFMQSHSHNDGRLRELIFYSAHAKSGLITKIRVEPKEVAAIKWISLQDLQNEYTQNPQTIIISSDKPLWKKIFESLKIVAQS